MASAHSLIPGLQYPIVDGPLSGNVCTVINNVTFPDTDERRRKIEVVIGEPGDGDTYYILPRFIGDTPLVDGDTDIAAAAAAAKAQRGQRVVTATLITDPMDERVDILRPNPAVVEQYVHRTMPNGKTDIEFLLEFVTNPTYRSSTGHAPNIALKGDTQGGKTMLVHVLAVEWAKALGLPKPMPVFTLSGSSGITDFDLFGQPTTYTGPDGRERIVWLPGTLALAASVGGILYADEINAVSERVTSSMHPMLDHRRCFINRNRPVPVPGGGFMPETVNVNPMLWCVSTYNEGYRGMSQQNEAFLNRFRHIEWDYDSAVEKTLVKFQSVLILGDAVRQARSQGVLRTPVGTAALQNLVTDVIVHGVSMGLNIFVGMFPPVERILVRDIIRDRSIDVLLEAEANPTTTATPEATTV